MDRMHREQRGGGERKPLSFRQRPEKKKDQERSGAVQKDAHGVKSKGVHPPQAMLHRLKEYLKRPVGKSPFADRMHEERCGVTEAFDSRVLYDESHIVPYEFVAEAAGVDQKRGTDEKKKGLQQRRDRRRDARRFFGKYGFFRTWKKDKPDIGTRQTQLFGDLTNAFLRVLRTDGFGGFFGDGVGQAISLGFVTFGVRPSVESSLRV